MHSGTSGSSVGALGLGFRVAVRERVHNSDMTCLVCLCICILVHSILRHVIVSACLCLCISVMHLPTCITHSQQSAHGVSVLMHFNYALAHLCYALATKCRTSPRSAHPSVVSDPPCFASQLLALHWHLSFLHNQLTHPPISAQYTHPHTHRYMLPLIEGQHPNFVQGICLILTRKHAADLSTVHTCVVQHTW